MRILHLVHDLPPDSRGGTQEYVLQLARLQRDAGHAVGVIAGAAAHAEGGETRHAVEERLDVWRLRRDHAAEPAPSETGCARLGDEVERIARGFAPDVAHVHHWSGLGRDLVARLGAALDAPVVVTLHDLYVTCPRFFRMPDHRRLCARDASPADCAACVAPDVGVDPGDAAALAGVTARLAERAAAYRDELARADLVLAVSAAQRDLLRGLPGFSAPRIDVLPIGVNAPPPPGPPPAPGERLRVVSWAGFDPRKGLQDLVRAVAVGPARGAAELHLHGRPGEPRYMDELRALAGDAPVVLHGEYDAAERAAFGGRYDVAVFPYLAWETHALAVDEALFAGLPVITSDRGAPPARLGGRGTTYPAGDAAALGRLLAELASDRARLDRMRAAPHGAIDLAEHHRALAARYARLTA